MNKREVNVDVGKPYRGIKYEEKICSSAKIK